jgi:hypothetical protein
MFAVTGRESFSGLVAWPKTLPTPLGGTAPTARIKSTGNATTSSDAGPILGEGSFELGHSPPRLVSEESVPIDIALLPFCGEPDNVHWTFQSPLFYKDDMVWQGDYGANWVVKY